MGLAGSAFGLGGMVSGSIMLVFDGHGNWGIIVSGGGGGAGASTIKGASGGGQLQVTSADNIYQMEGAQGQFGGSYGTIVMAGPVPIPVSGTGEFVVGKGYMGGQGTLGVGFPGFEMHGIVERAKILTSGTLPIGDGQRGDANSLSMGILTSSPALDIVSKLTDAATYKLIIDMSYSSVAEGLGPGQMVAWSSSAGYYAVSSSDASSWYDW